MRPQTLTTLNLLTLDDRSDGECGSERQKTMQPITTKAPRTLRFTKEFIHFNISLFLVFLSALSVLVVNPFEIAKIL
jgi:hypothetical protein